MFLYEVIYNKDQEPQVRILACKSYDTVAMVPERIKDYPVVEIAPYAFSSQKKKEPEGIWWSEYGMDQEDCPWLEGERLAEVILPKSIKKIGNYAFYNCFQLKRFESGSGIKDIGTGIFTGCTKVEELSFAMGKEARSCLSEVISELSQVLVVTCQYEDGMAKFLLPEFYEEDVECTRARLLVVSTHGCGHRYRYCISGSNLNYREYDQLFFHFSLLEKEQVVVKAALFRLFYPYELLEASRDAYHSYVDEHWKAAVAFVLEEREDGMITWLLSLIRPDEKKLLWITQMAMDANWEGAVSELMDYKYLHIKKEKKRFDL